MNTTLGGRLKLVRGKLSQTAVAKDMGMPQTTWSTYENNKNQPDTEFLLRVCDMYRISRDWLFFGEGPMHALPAPQAAVARSWTPMVQVQQPGADDPWTRAPWQEAPVVGLGNCGPNDWYSPDSLALRTIMPIPYPYRPEMFAVLAMGNSMQPAGIYQGFVLFCDPQETPVPGDTVYVEKRSGMAAVKKFLKFDDKQLHLKGWLPPDAKGDQQPYYEEINRDEVVRVVCVVVIKLKA